MDLIQIHFIKYQVSIQAHGMKHEQICVWFKTSGDLSAIDELAWVSRTQALTAIALFTSRVHTTVPDFPNTVHVIYLKHTLISAGIERREWSLIVFCSPCFYWNERQHVDVSRWLKGCVFLRSKSGSFP